MKKLSLTLFVLIISLSGCNFADNSSAIKDNKTEKADDAQLNEKTIEKKQDKIPEKKDDSGLEKNKKPGMADDILFEEDTGLSW